MFELSGVIAGFAILAILIYMKVDFGRAVLAASGLLLLFSEPSLTGLYWIWDITRDHETLRLMAIIVQIAFLGFLYKDSDQVMRMIKELRNAFPDRRMVMASVPAIFGLMPMPGGALVSAPMIDEEGNELDLDGTDKTFLNWWWRHIWFTVYPLSTGLIFASTLSGVNLYRIAVFNLPIFISQIVIGVYWGLKKIDFKATSGSGLNPSLLIYELSPIVVALSLNIILGIPLYLSLLLAILLLFFQNRDKYSAKRLPRTFKDGFSFDLLLAAYGIMLFKGLIERAGALAPVVESLGDQVPVLLVVILAAYGIGVLFGHLPGAIGVGFPVLLPLLPVISVRTVSLTFIFIFLGYFTSPIHLCIILTIQYFKIEMKRFYKRMFIPLVVLVTTIMIWLFITGTLFMFW